MDRVFKILKKLFYIPILFFMLTAMQYSAQASGMAKCVGLMCQSYGPEAWNKGVFGLINEVYRRQVQNVMNIPVPRDLLHWTTAGNLVGDVMRIPGVSRGLEIAGEGGLAVPLPILQGMGAMTGPALQQALALGKESIAVRAVIGGIESNRALPTAPDLLIPQKMRVAVIGHIPSRSIQNVNKLLGRELGRGVEGVVYEMAGDPTRVVKIYNHGLKSAENQIHGLLGLEEKIAQAGLQDKMEVVKTLEYGVDAQGRAFTVHPMVTGEPSNQLMSPAHLQELFDLNKILIRRHPIAQKLIQLGYTEDHLSRMSTMGNFFRTPAGKWIVIDPK